MTPRRKPTTECDAFIVELDSDRDSALDLAGSALQPQTLRHGHGVFGSHQRDLLMASMRAGAASFWSGTISPAVLADALLAPPRAARNTPPRKTHGKMLMFWGAKGGSGHNPRRQFCHRPPHRKRGGEVALLDFNPQLAMSPCSSDSTPRFTVADALLKSPTPGPRIHFHSRIRASQRRIRACRARYLHSVPPEEQHASAS